MIFKHLVNHPVAYLTDVLRKFIRSSRLNKKHILFVVALSAVIRFGQVFLPSRWLFRWMGIHKGQVELCTLATDAQIYRARKTGQFIENICDRTPWEAKCLVKAIILRYYLDREDIPYVLYVGMAKGEAQSDTTFLAHAWMTVGRSAVVGWEGHKRFVILSSYVSRSIANSVIL